MASEWKPIDYLAIDGKDPFEKLIAVIDSPHADKIYLAKEFTKADLIMELMRIRYLLNDHEA